MRSPALLRQALLSSKRRMEKELLVALFRRFVFPHSLPRHAGYHRSFLVEVEEEASFQMPSYFKPKSFELEHYQLLSGPVLHLVSPLRASSAAKSLLDLSSSDL